MEVTALCLIFICQMVLPISLERYNFVYFQNLNKTLNENQLTKRNQFALINMVIGFVLMGRGIYYIMMNESYVASVILIFISIAIMTIYILISSFIFYKKLKKLTKNKKVVQFVKTSHGPLINALFLIVFIVSMIIVFYFKLSLFALLASVLAQVTTYFISYKITKLPIKINDTKSIIKMRKEMNLFCVLINVLHISIIAMTIPSTESQNDALVLSIPFIILTLALFIYSKSLYDFSKKENILC